MINPETDSGPVWARKRLCLLVVPFVVAAMICLVAAQLPVIETTDTSGITEADCDGVKYDPQKQICCGKKVYDKKDKDGKTQYDMCCGNMEAGTPYNSETHGCCDGTEKYDLNTEGCCDGKTKYSKKTHFCCNKEVRKITPRPN